MASLYDICWVRPQRFKSFHYRAVCFLVPFFLVAFSPVADRLVYTYRPLVSLSRDTSPFFDLPFFLLFGTWHSI
jgi:hypothetical protein